MKKQALLVALVSTALMAETVYVVKSGDNLSEILDMVGVSPIYGKNGSLKKTIKINKLKDANVLYVGQKITIPDGESDFYDNEEEVNCDVVNCSETLLTESEIIEPQPIEEAKRSFDANFSMGNFSFRSLAHNNGLMRINGGTNRLEIASNSELGNINQRLSISGDLLVLAKDIPFKIGPKNSLLMEYKFETIFTKEFYNFAGGAGMQDLIGGYNSNETGLTITKSLTPFVEIGGGLKSDYFKSKIDFRYKRFLGSETSKLKIKSGNAYSLQFMKPMFNVGTSNVSGLVGYQIINTKTNMTKDTETKGVFGVNVDW